MPVYLIGIDDTDLIDTPGTGKLARRLAADLEDAGGQSLGTTRHQFLIDPRIPSTARNHGVCLAIDWRKPLEELQTLTDRIGEWSVPGSDPGVCIARAGSVPDDVMRWGVRVSQEVLTKAEAESIAASFGIWLRALGGTGGGIIGALASVGQRAEGNRGHFSDLPGLRDLPDLVTAADLETIGVVIDRGEDKSSRADRYLTLGWVRPRLLGGEPVWTVRWSDEHDAWIAVDQKRNKAVE